MKTYYVIVLNEDNSVTVTRIADKRPTLEELYSCIGCKSIEIIHPEEPVLGDSIRMIVDEEGLLNDSLYNPLASVAYGYQQLFGKALLVEEDPEDSTELVGFDFIRAAKLADHIRAIWG